MWLSKKTVLMAFFIILISIFLLGLPEVCPISSAHSSINIGAKPSSIKKQDRINISEHKITATEAKELKQNLGIWQPDQNYNEIICGHGTGLRSPTEEEWAAIMSNSFIVDKIVADPPIQTESIDLTTTPWFPPIGDQGHQGSCAAWAVGYYTKTFQEAKEHNWDLSGKPSDKIISPSFIYNLANNGKDEGSYLSSLIGLICSVGACSLARMPYNPSDYTSWPSEQAWTEAMLYRGADSGMSYLNLQNNEGLTNLKNLLSSGNLAIIAVDASKIQDKFTGWSLLDANDMLTLDNYANPSPNHAGTIVGYDDTFAYTEQGETRYGAFKIANSWGIDLLPSPYSWEHILDGCYWVSYEAMRQSVETCIFYNDKVGYEPELIATFEVNHAKRGECNITMGAGDVSHPIITKDFNSYIQGGDWPFCPNKILFDITEFKNFVDTNNKQYFLQVLDFGSLTTGTINHFAINNIVSSDLPLATVNNGNVFANITRCPFLLRVPEDFPTIQSAINVAYPRDVISVAPATYYENVVANKSISLLGTGVENTIIDGGLSGNVLAITASNVTVSDFTIQRSGMLSSNNCGIFVSASSSGDKISSNKIINNGYGIYLQSSSKNILFQNNVTENSIYGIFLTNSQNNTLRNNQMDLNNLNFGVEVSGTLTDFINDADASNTVDGKPVYYWVNKKDAIIPADAGYVALVNCTGITVQNLTLDKLQQGILIAYTNDSLILKNTLSNCYHGIDCYYSSNNILNQNLFDADSTGVALSNSQNNIILMNDFEDYVGFGIYVNPPSSTNNILYHNNFKNSYPVNTFSSLSNIWDAGYPSGGNYWSDYDGTDEFSGPYQNVTGGDGIWDNPYIIDSNNKDRYPLAFPYETQPPTITIKSPENKTYAVNSSIPLTFTVDEFTTWIGYSLNGQPNATTTSNTTLLTLPDGWHYVVVYANDTFGNMGISDVMHFTVDTTAPTTLHDYDGLWHTTDYTITLAAADYTSGVAETYYKINNGVTRIVSADGQPLITTEGADNKLEYWSADGAGNAEDHHILTGIKLDKTAPTGSIVINNGDASTTSTTVMLTLTYADADSSVSQIRYSSDGVWDTEIWEAPSATKSWTLTSGDGTKTVYYQIKDSAGLTSIYSDTILLDTMAPTGSVVINNGDASTTSTSVTLTLTYTDAASGVYQVRYSNDGVWDTEPWELPSTTKAWTLTSGDGAKTVYYQIRDNAGLLSSIYSDSISLQSPSLSPTPSPSPSASPSPQPTPSPSPSPAPTPTFTPTPQPTSSPAPPPEGRSLFLFAIVVGAIFAAFGVAAFLLRKRR